MKDLKGKKIAILVTDGFEEIEFTEPKKALEGAGATVEVVTPDGGKVKAWDHDKWGGEYKVDRKVADASPNDYDGLMLPGGVMNPDQLRQNNDAVKFAKGFFERKKPVAAICHSPQLLIEAGVVDGRRLTSYNSLKTDLKNAGAHWVDEEVVVDRGLVTSRNPGDLKAFNRKMIEEFSEGIHKDQTV
jgi:protease I